MEKNKLIVGVPVKGDRESFTAMYFSLMSSTHEFDELVIATPDLNCTDEISKLKLSNGPKITILTEPFKTPLEAYNRLFEYAKLHKCDLFLTQTDVIFPKLYKRDWLKHMRDVAQNENIGAVTCINGGGVSGPDYIDGFNWLGGWCSYYPNRTVELIGGYDDNFPNGYGVDIEHTYRIVKAGLQIARLNYWVDHHMMNERLHDNDSNTEQMKKESSKYFKKKWNL